MKIKNMIKLGAAVLSLSLSLSPLALAISTDGAVETGNVKLNRSGNNEWRVGSQVGANATPAADGAGSLGIYNVAGSSYAVSFSSGSEAYFYGPIGLPRFTTAQLQGTTVGIGIPRRTGLLVLNTTLSLPCISTGTTQGSWAIIGASVTATTVGTSPQCF